MSEETAGTSCAEAGVDFSALPNPIAKLFEQFFSRLTAGTLVIELPSGKRLVASASSAGPDAILRIVRWRALRRLAARGDLGFAEGFMEGDWTTPDLVRLFTWSLANEAALAPAWGGAFLQRLIDRVAHFRRANTKRGSRRNIAAHYDLGNDFYLAWLDETMSYSSALFSKENEALQDAQIAKIDRAIQLLDVSPGQSVLEIGCGWGALAERLIKTRQAQVTGITLSREQLAVAEKRVRRADPSGMSRMIIKDYRDVTERFDRIVSIEMFEAAGEAYWPLYFQKLRDCLTPGGVAVLQVITIAEDRFADYRKRPDFIQRYIFPGGMLPTVTRMRSLVTEAGLTLDHIELFGQSYARTLALWRDRFLRAWPTMQGSVGSERFRNMWHYYLAYCEVGFRNEALNVGMYRIVRS